MSADELRRLDRMQGTLDDLMRAEVSRAECLATLEEKQRTTDSRLDRVERGGIGVLVLGAGAALSLIWDSIKGGKHP